MLQPRKPNVLTKPLPYRDPVEEAKRLEEMRRYQYLRDSAKPGFKVDTGYKPNTVDHAVAQQQYMQSRGVPTVPINQVVLEDQIVDPNLNPNTYSNRTKKAVNTDVVSYAKGGRIMKRKTIPLYAGGGQMLQTAGGVASMIPGIGTVVGAGLNIAGGLMNANDAEEQRQEQMRQYLAKQQQEDQLALEDYNVQGNTGVQYYARGGGLPKSASNGNPIIGGNLIPLDNNTELVVGNKHNENSIDGQYGVTLSDENGQPQANVEDAEVIKDGDYVFSDRLKSSNGKTFANRIKTLTTRKVGIQDKAKTSMTNRHTDGYTRMIEGIELQEQQLQDEQEFVKMLQPKTTSTVPMLASGGPIKPSGMEDEYLYPDTLGSVPLVPTPTVILEPETDNRFMQNFAPQLIDNVGNAIINSRTPNLPRPKLAKARSLDKTINVNPQLSAVTEGVESGVQDILGNTSNSNVARANMASLRLKGIQAKGNIYANKEAQERIIKNANTQNLQNIDNTNAGTLNQSAMLEFQRANEVNSRTSANLANLSSDISRAQETTNLQTNVDETMLLSLLDDKTGAKMRAMENNPYFARNPKLRNAIKVEVARRKALKS